MLTKRVLAVLILVLLSLPAMLVWASQPKSPPANKLTPKVAPDKGTFSWKLMNSKVVDAGQVFESSEGTIVTGYTLESDAVGQADGKLITGGKFRIAITVFKPAKDKPGQKAGKWYVVGNWSITDSEASEKAVQARHSGDVVKGDLKAELPFNPASEKGHLGALVRIPASPVGKRWIKGEGSFSGNEKFEGTIYGQYKQWPGKADSKVGG